MRGDWIRKLDVVAVIGAQLVAFRTKMLSIPSKIGPLLLGQRSLPEIVRILTEGIEEALRELKGFRQEDFDARRAERATRNGQPELTASAKEARKRAAKAHK